MFATHLLAAGRVADRHRRRAHRGFTLVEAVVAVMIAALAGATLLLGTTSALQSVNTAQEETIAAGIARLLVDEIIGGRYHALGADGYQIDLGPSAWESSGVGRERFDDIDDYTGFQAQPPQGPLGIMLGTDDGEGGQRHPNFQITSGLLDNWWEEIEVYYVDAADLTTRLPYGQPSDYRAVEVRIYDDDPSGGGRELARIRRVVAYVPPM